MMRTLGGTSNAINPRTSVVTPSPYQQAVYDFIQRGQGNAVISAVAGSGKTTTLIEALRLIPPYKSVVFLAFNKSIVQELSSRVPEGVKVSTIHSLGFSVLRSKYPNFVTTADKAKNIWANSDFLSVIEFGREEYDLVSDAGMKFKEYAHHIIRLSELMRASLDVTPEGGLQVLEHHEVENVTGRDHKIASAFVRRLMTVKDQIDFMDMIYMPYAENLYKPRYDIVFVDEAQDFNPLQIEIVKRILRRDGRFVAVGDENQSIYGFTGADPRAFEKFKELPNTSVLPLSVCYRCATSIVEEAKTIVPQIEPFSGAKEGTVLRLSSPVNNFLSDLREGDFVIARTARPLVALYLDLLERGRIASIKGVDMSAPLLNLLKHLNPQKLSDLPALLDAQQEIIFQEVEQAKALIPPNDASYSGLLASHERKLVNFLEKKDLLLLLKRGLRTVDALTQRIESVFRDNNEGILLCTAHKSKGLEADRVFIIRPDQFPHKKATLPWQLRQEYNLKYVAITRAKKELYFVYPEAWKDGDTEDASSMVAVG